MNNPVEPPKDKTSPERDKPKIITPLKPLKKPHLSGLFNSISNQDKINFARHLAMIVKAGMPVQEGLRIIRAQTKVKTLQAIIDQLIDDLNNGHFLADSLAQYENLFGNFFVNIIRVGESSGTLSKNLLYLAEELRKAKQLRSKVKSAMIYPMIILIATSAMIAFLAFFVFPKLMPLFQSFNVKLPATTTALIAVMDFIQNSGLYLLGALLLLGMTFRILLKRVDSFKYAMHVIILHMPVVSDLSVNINLVNFARVLALLLKSGMHIADALDITSKTFTNVLYERAILKADEEVRRGGQIATYMTAHEKLFPPLFHGMIKVGESTGNLEENLEYLAEFYEDETDNKLAILTSLLEPFLLLLMGLTVGFVALSIITPIYSISQGIK